MNIDRCWSFRSLQIQTCKDTLSFFLRHVQALKLTQNNKWTTQYVFVCWTLRTSQLQEYCNTFVPTIFKYSNQTHTVFADMSKFPNWNNAMKPILLKHSKFPKSKWNEHIVGYLLTFRAPHDQTSNAHHLVFNILKFPNSSKAMKTHRFFNISNFSDETKTQFNAVFNLETCTAVVDHTISIILTY